MGALCSIIPNENKQYSVKIDGTTVLFHIDKTNLIGTFNAYAESSSENNVYYTFVVLQHMDKEYLLVNRRRSFDKLDYFGVYQFETSYLGIMLCFEECSDKQTIYLQISSVNKNILVYKDIDIPIVHPYLQKLVSRAQK